MATETPFVPTASPWELDDRGWCPEADSFENQRLIAKAPVLFELATALAGTEGVWADDWLNELARHCGLVVASAKPSVES